MAAAIAPLTTTTAFVRGLGDCSSSPLPTRVAAHAAAALGPALEAALERTEEVAGLQPCEAVTTFARVLVEERAATRHPDANVDPVPFAAPAATIAAGAGCDASQVVRAFALGCEAQLRIALALGESPAARGWDIACATGGIGAAVAAVLAVASSGDALQSAIGIAGSQTVGRIAAAGTRAGAYYVGRAAGNGYLSFLLASRGFTAPANPFDAERGYLRILTAAPSAEPLSQGWGARWLLLDLPVSSTAPHDVGLEVLLASFAEAGDA